ncbi:MAG: phoH, partial [Jatrophihabitantaceae bacterium]|nr:phoH [Jatrophihabitantaceae bacterium]
VQDILDGVEDVHFATLTSADVVRHRLVADIVDAYGRHDAETLAAHPPTTVPRRDARSSRNQR